MATQCQTCFGVYESFGADGLPYFHVCPPVTCAVVKRDGRVGLVPLRRLLPTDIVRVQRGATVVPVAIADLLPDDQRLGDVSVPRPNGRDENPVVVVDAQRRRVTRIKAEGDGVRDVAPDAPAQLPVLDAP